MLPYNWITQIRLPLCPDGSQLLKIGALGTSPAYLLGDVGVLYIALWHMPQYMTNNWKEIIWHFLD